MRIVVAGATGVIGRRLVPWLVEEGHDVTGLTRSRHRASRLARQGARAIVVDVFDRPALVDALRRSRPEVVLHQLTDLASPRGRGIGAEELSRTARLRDIGTTNLVDAAALINASRMIAQSVAFLYAPGPEPHTEGDALLEPDDAGPPTVAGIRSLEDRVLHDGRLQGVVLRYGFLYGSGTGFRTPTLVPSVHVDAAAWAAVRALDPTAAGIYNIVDDPGPVDNLRARRELGWEPSRRRPSRRSSRRANRPDAAIPDEAS